jgi:dipeptidase E
MKYYLSSYKLGDRTSELIEMLPVGSRLAYIPNALDPYPDEERKLRGNNADMDSLRELGYEVELVDLRDFFDKRAMLEEKLGEVSGVWVRGGNTFALRQAMKLSGFDDLIIERAKAKEKNGSDFFYGGYSAGACVLSPELRGIHLCDDPNAQPYGDIPTMWDGLGLIDFAIAPHYRSEHPESEMIEDVVKYYEAEGMTYRTLRDGEVIIIA